MSKLGVIAFFIVFFTGKIFCFPDMRYYPHEVVQLGNALTRASKTKDALDFKLSKVRFKGLSGYHGFCPITNYNVLINEDGEDSYCLITSPEGETETSYFYMEMDSNNSNIIFKYFYFDKGRIVVTRSSKEACACWQSWIT